MESECAGNFFQSLENGRKIFPIIGKNGRIFPTIGKKFSNHWKKRAGFSNHWKVFFQSLENRGGGFAVGAAWARKEVAKRGGGAILQAVL
ncbi:MAG: hypothetical protein IKQ15_07590 [Kiritimatiellae bacterium]|nr:hypothetical protein [Kiritimatiellia bacterium]